MRDNILKWCSELARSVVLVVKAQYIFSSLYMFEWIQSEVGIAGIMFFQSETGAQVFQFLKINKPELVSRAASLLLNPVCVMKALLHQTNMHCPVWKLWKLLRRNRNIRPGKIHYRGTIAYLVQHWLIMDTLTMCSMNQFSSI